MTTMMKMVLSDVVKTVLFAFKIYLEFDVCNSDVCDFKSIKKIIYIGTDKAVRNYS